MKIICIILSMLLISCGGSGGGENGSNENTVEQLSSASSLNPNCVNLTGATAVYFDFESGFLVNLAFTPLLTSIGSVIPGGDGSFWSLPPGYVGQVLTNGAIIQRTDNQVLFKHTSGEQLFTDPATAFNQQLSSALATFQLTINDATFICGRDTPFSVGPLPGRLISGLYNAGQHTFIVVIRSVDAGVVAQFSTRVAAGPAQKFSKLAGNVFLPMVCAQFPGGSGEQPECRDGQDNDNDLRADWPLDLECKSPDDDDELNL